MVDFEFGTSWRFELGSAVKLILFVFQIREYADICIMTDFHHVSVYVRQSAYIRHVTSKKIFDMMTRHT